ncbi:hypothetical protein GGR54DRAFT_641273 [Hypoxylon sp. NC1633]|nr:hypothetical protein GGR54DRAFT_641273 [Hypoxylon sp. NC1633]
MGNSLSAEAPWRSQRTTQFKLSKPKTGNPTAAGLLNPNGTSNSARPSPAARRLSLPPTPSPAASPGPPQADPVGAVSVSDSKKETESKFRFSRRLFRSNTSKESPHRRQRSSSVVEVSNSQKERWLARADSLRNGSEEGSNYGQTSLQGSLSMNASRSSFGYDTGSYEAKRLLNLVEEPPRDNSSVIWENRIHISEAMRSDLRGRRPSVPETTTSPITRFVSDISLYTPMRRRSLMTPGIATREMRADPEPPKPRTRYSLPSTPARRESMESIGVGTISMPPLMVNSDTVPRALTPCETDYQQTGAFKHGTLRITNGSPARTPAYDLSDGVHRDDPEAQSAGGLASGYFGMTSAKDGSSTAPENVEVQNAESDHNPSASSPPDVTVTKCSIQPQTPWSSPEHQLSQSIQTEGKLQIPQMQVTSKHTAVEDDLFGDGPDEYLGAEVLDVRVDESAKSQPPRPKLSSERRNSREISRSDSGIASPASEYSHAPLSKADSGYSSSVSLRSFSLKPQVSEKESASVVEDEAEPKPGVEQGVQATDSEFTNSTSMLPNVVVPRPKDRASPPPVPMKDPHRIHIGSPKASGGLSPFQQNYRSVTSNHSQMPERVLAPSIRNQANSIVASRRASLRNSTVSNSALSITTSFRKPGKLQRFLSGGRAPLTVYNTHPSEDTSVPEITGDMHAKLQAHTGLLPGSLRRLALKSAASRETLGTILSVGSAELLQDDDVSPTISSGQLRALDRKQGTPISSIESTITSTTSLSLLKPQIRRKPVPGRSNNFSVERKLAQLPGIGGGNRGLEETIQAASRHSIGGAIHGPSRHSFENARVPRYSVPAPQLTRSNTTTVARSSYELAAGKSHSTTSLQLPPAPPHVKISKSPPPVSMRTRNIGSLRVPPPPRSKSTPPENKRRPARPPYSRRGSREGDLRGNDVTSIFAPNHPTMSRRSSRESFHAHPPAQAYRYNGTPPLMPAGNNPQASRYRTGAAETRVPNWDVPVGHGPSLSRRPSSDYSRRGSLASQSSHLSSATTRPSFFRQQHHSQPNLPSLNRRSSYDEYNLVPQDSLIRDNGPYPTLSRNGQTVVTDPWSGRPMSMPQQFDKPLDIPIRHPSHSSRRHHRNRSMDQDGNPAPYRVLHSYNSPAYRNVPIWR